MERVSGAYLCDRRIFRRPSGGTTPLWCVSATRLPAHVALDTTHAEALTTAWVTMGIQ